MSSQIHDLGYRAYDGERAGVLWAVRSLALHSIRRALGLKRAGKHKIVPIITIALAFLPAIVLVGLSAFLPGIDANDLISYGEYFGFTSFALFLFTAVAAPGVLTTDRTSGMLALYLASPLNRTTYVLAKAIGIFLVMLLVTVAPILFLVLAYTFVGSGPGGLLDFLELMGRALLAGSIAAAFFTGLGMFLSSIPKRWGIASVCIIASLLVPSIVTGVLTEGTNTSDLVAYAAPGDIVGKAWQFVLDDPITTGVIAPDDPNCNDGAFAEVARCTPLAIDALSSAGVVSAALGYAFLCLGLTWWRYQTMDVDR